ncbi:MAG: cytochrome c biogenesis protein CcdA [Chloroflexi bacterium]|nr:MAG: cytochrome c biogenesis protein CcdA [Chloroflexota bacterium]
MSATSRSAPSSRRGLTTAPFRAASSSRCVPRAAVWLIPFPPAPRAGWCAHRRRKGRRTEPGETKARPLGYAGRVNVAIAFGAGILSFLSPCVLPLVPAFLVNMAGEAALAGTQRLRTVAHALAFVLGFSVVFTLLWVAIALVGALAGELVYWLQRIGGILLIVLGMHMVGLITIPFLMRELDLRLEGNTSGLPRSFLIGVAFGVGFTPCVGPYLALILDLLLNEDLASGAVLLLAYALGLGVPFLVIAAGIGGTRRATRVLARGIRVLNLAGGTLVIVMGLVLVTGQFARLPQLFTFL